MSTRSKSQRPSRPSTAPAPQPARGVVATPPPGASLSRPVVHVPAVMTPDGAGGWSVRPGKPVLTSETMGTAEAGRILSLALRTIAVLCEEGIFPGAFKPGGRRCSHWKIPRGAVLARLTSPIE